MRIMRIIMKGSSVMKFTEIEKILMGDGWVLKNVKGSHYQYVHPTKPGKVTVPYHGGDISTIIVKSIFRQAGI